MDRLKGSFLPYILFSSISIFSSSPHSSLPMAPPPDKIGSVTYKDLESILEHWKCVGKVSGKDCGISRFVGEQKKLHVLPCGHYLCEDCLATRKQDRSDKPMCPAEQCVLMCQQTKNPKYTVGNGDPPKAQHIEDFVVKFRETGHQCRNSTFHKPKDHHSCSIDMMRCVLDPVTDKDGSYLCAVCMYKESDLSVEGIRSAKESRASNDFTLFDRTIDQNLLNNRKPWHKSMLNLGEMRTFIARLLICVVCKTEFGKSSNLTRRLCGGNLYCDDCEKKSKKELEECRICFDIHEMPTGLYSNLLRVPMDFKAMGEIKFGDYRKCEKCSSYHPQEHFPPTHYAANGNENRCFFCFVDPGN